jgi:hypothetical protein
MWIIKQENSIITNWYKKEIAKGRMLNFHSNHTYQIKINTAKGFLRRIFGLSNKCFWTENEKLAFEILSKNEFPIKIIKTLIRSIKFELTQESSQNQDDTIFLSCNDETLNSIVSNEHTNFRSLTYTKESKIFYNLIFHKQN